MFMRPPERVKATPGSHMETSNQTPDATAAAHKLYWGSDKSVNQIAEELDLSKGALYAMIRPLQAGLGCPLCGDEVVFPNRTARDKGVMGCASCGWEGGEDETISYGGEGAVTLPDFDEPEPVPPPPASTMSVRNRTRAGGALLGAAAGLALVIWAKRK